MTQAALPLLVSALAAHSLGGLLAFVTRRRVGRWLSDALALLAAAALVGAGALALLAEAPLTTSVARLGNLSSYRLRVDRLAGLMLVLQGVIEWFVALAMPRLLVTEGDERRQGLVRAACHVLGAALALVFVADDTLLWIAGWQGVAVASFLVMVVSGDRAARRAGFGYAVITQVGLACLMAALLLLARDAGGLDFAALRAATVHGRPGLFVAFAGLVGFAALAGLAPLHLWLRYLNPVVAAPAAALIGGVAVLAGAFGMVRFSFELVPPPSWQWSVVVIVLGCASVLYGVLYALLERDLVRVVACFAVHGVGLIFVGIGVASLARAEGAQGVAALALGATLMQVLAHAGAIALMALAAGAVRVAAGADLEKLGGLARTMPASSTGFVLALASVCGLPPLLGFAAHWAVVQALFRGFGLHGDVARLLLPAVLGVVVLASAAGLGVAVRVLGPVFLGRPRAGRAGQEIGGGARLALWGLSLLLIAGGAAAGAVGALTTRAMSGLGLGDTAMLAAGAGRAALQRTTVLAGPATSVAPAVLTGVGIAIALLVWLGGRGAARVRRGPSWSGGATPSSDAQYTASAYAQPLRHVFRKLLWPGTVLARLRPGERPEQQVGVVEARVYVPLRRVLLWVGEVARWAQRETVLHCLTYVFIMLVALLAAVMLWA